MQLYSTNDHSHKVTLQEAVFRGLPPDNGLYMPEKFNTLPQSFFENIDQLSFQEIAYEVTKCMIGDDEISNADLKVIIDQAVNFTAPIVHVNDNYYTLELYHGPTLAFKDFGARFMAGLMGHFLQKNNQEINILVATSGDTGGAVANGFYKTPGVNVTILYPSGKVSDFQELQLTTLGHNITALEIDGTFDDCQAMVKKAFLDQELSKKHNLSSANSINIARLIPQSFYYFNAYAQLKRLGKEKIVFCIPSGNFGNICAGLFAQKMGLPVHHFVAATNANDTFVQFLNTGDFKPKPSVETVSNAMDVGNPSNFARIFELFGKDVQSVRKNITGYSFDDVAIRQSVIDVYSKTGYLMDPHGAVGYLGLQSYFKDHHDKDTVGVFLHTAHPAKFINTYSEAMKPKVEIPEALSSLSSKKKLSIKMDSKFESLKNYLNTR